MRLYSRKRIVVYSMLLSLAAACGKKAPVPVISFDDPYRPVMIITGDAAITGDIKSGDREVSGLFAFLRDTFQKISVELLYEKRHDTLFITPMLPLDGGMRFKWQFNNGSEVFTQEFSTPLQKPTDKPEPEIVSLYPLSDTIPSNTLVFHINFNVPMNEDLSAYRNIQLLDEKGAAKQFAWRQKSGWADSSTQLVLMVHPGRIKRGIKYAEIDGMLFEPGKRYTLVVTDSLKDQAGRKLKTEYRKTFYIAAPDRTSPQKPQLTTPKAGSREALAMHFNEGMDYGCMLIGCSVTDDRGNVVQGRIKSISDKVWHFIPDQPWTADTYKLVLNDYVTDFASNHLGRRFEETAIGEMGNTAGAELRFEVR